MKTIEQPLFALHTVINDRYELIELLGSGGMGLVVRAIDRKLDGISVVLKFLHSHLTDDENQFKRFKNEVLLMRELTHPNIVRTFDLGESTEGQFFITMECIKGSSLREVLKEDKGKGLDFEYHVRILYDIAIGMAYAHQKGVVHRDLKPDNILISEAGEVKITDFGLARTLLQSECLTSVGHAVGTPQYMSPEQLKGEVPDPRCDIYSFGILAYELFTGERPFQADNYLELARQHLTDSLPKLDKKSTKAPSWYQAFLEQCTAKQRSRRFQTFDEIIEVLEPLIKAPPAHSSSTSVKKRRPSQIRKWRARSVWRDLLPGVLIFSIVFWGTVILVCTIASNNQPLRMKIVPPLFRLENAWEGLDLSYLTGPILYSVIASVEGKSNKSLSSRIVDAFSRGIGVRETRVHANTETLLAAIEGNESYDLTELLLAGGVSPNIYTNPQINKGQEEHLLLYVIRNLSPAHISLFIRYGIELTKQHPDTGHNGLMIAVSKPAAALEVTKTLVQGIKANPRFNIAFTQKDKTAKKTALFYAVDRQDDLSPLLVELLVKHSSLADRDASDRTILMYAAHFGSVEDTRVILEHGGMEIMSMKTKGRTALHFASERSDNLEEAAKIAKVLLNYGAQAQVPDYQGMTPLMLAAEVGNIQLVKELLFHLPKTAVLSKDAQGRTAKGVAQQRGYSELVSLFDQHH